MYSIKIVFFLTKKRTIQELFKATRVFIKRAAPRPVIPQEKELSAIMLKTGQGILKRDIENGLSKYCVGVGSFKTCVDYAGREYEERALPKPLPGALTFVKK